MDTGWKDCVTFRGLKDRCYKIIQKVDRVAEEGLEYSPSV